MLYFCHVVTPKDQNRTSVIRSGATSSDIMGEFSFLVSARSSRTYASYYCRSFPQRAMALDTSQHMLAVSGQRVVMKPRYVYLILVATCFISHCLNSSLEQQYLGSTTDGLITQHGHGTLPPGISCSLFHRRSSTDARLSH